MTGQETAHGPKHKRDLTRRKVVVAGAGAVVAAGVGGSFAAGAFAGEETAAARGRTAGAAAEACYKLTSETTEVPYYIDADKLRSSGLTSVASGVSASMIAFAGGGSPQRLESGSENLRMVLEDPV
ncbi:hypothetical protein ACIQUU_20360 [Streptomyces sp. NPDC101116]|uniref:hypothetical protein n=1 Tax=Streptomyces sp. NPDC101116 TaxID=3366107 RepID=UPI00380C88DF